MRKVFRYEFKVQDNFSIQMPVGAEILHVNTQKNQPCLWALVDPKARAETRWFRVLGTGHAISEEYVSLGDYVGTFFLYDKSFVGHLFVDGSVK